ncbi:MULTISPECIES: bile acid:sodium symporter family protein [unclassified Luteococcus]|uniref:bile acid:sodium symporter family protein n=1 Tax=unclassified Luteococcus TaxID=2639923 RepID=UPI00313F079B
MTVDQLTGIVAAIAVPLFAVTSTASVGLQFTPRQILAPLRRGRLVLAGLMGNFVLTPFLTLTLCALLPVGPEVRSGLVTLACAAGAPFSLQLSGVARTSMSVASGLMLTSLMATTVFLPVVLPRLLTGMEVHAADLALLLFWTMAFPLLAGSGIAHSRPRLAAAASPAVGRAARGSMVVMLLNQAVADHREIAQLASTVAIVAITEMIVLTCVSGWCLGWLFGVSGVSVALSVSQRNMAAGTLVAATNMPGSAAVTCVVLSGFMALAVLLPVARWLGHRADRESC